MGAYGSLMGIADQGAQLKLASVKSDALGMQHVRFSQIQNGLAVFGADLIVHINADGSVASVNGYVVPNAVAVDTVAKLSEKQAAEVALKSTGLADGSVTESSLVVLNPDIIADLSQHQEGDRGGQDVRPGLRRRRRRDRHAGGWRPNRHADAHQDARPYAHAHANPDPGRAAGQRRL